MRYAISDIHGCCKTFHALLKKLHIKESDHLYLLGDYIDRGPDSKGVLDTIMNLDCKVVALMGNHEEMWLRTSDDTGSHAMNNLNINFWMKYGGLETLKSFSGTDTKPYLAFIGHLPPFHELNDYYLVHAELDFSLSDPLGKEGIHSMLWGRGRTYSGDKPVICGHTPLPIKRIKAALKTNKINIDNGCCHYYRIGQHHLLAYGLDDGRLYIQENIENRY